MTDLENRIAALSPAKRALLERRLRERGDRFEAAPILPRSSADRPPASFSQQRLWFLDQFNPGSAAYNMSRGIRIEGPLDQAVLERTLTEIVRRHETLRTTFAAENDAPVQVIHAFAPIAVRRIDLTAVPDSEKQAEMFRLMSEEAGRPFDLATGPLFRASLLQLEPEHHVLIVSMHHIISDGWSMGVLYSELFALYDSFVQGHASPLPPLPIQYGDFALWQRQRLQGDILLNQLNYWREALRDLPTLELPTDYSRPTMQTFTGAIARIQVPRNLVERLKVVSRQEGATLFMTLLAAFQTLLHRYTGQDDIVVGSPIAGRTRVEMEGLIGFFVNMLVLRTSLSGNPTFRQLLQRVEKVAHGAYAHQDIPFEKLVEELHPRRDPSRNPLFQVVLALQNTPRHAPSLSGLNIARINSTQAPSRFDLEAHFMENVDAIEGLIVYNTSLFDAKTIDRMMGNFRMLLEGIAADPDRLLSELPLLTEKERQQQLLEWNDTTTSYARDACVHKLVEHQVKTTPDALAVAYGKQRVTYRQLNDRSNQLAHYLQSLGVGRDMRVGVCIERSVQMIVAFLAVLKTGAAYVPVEPSYPPERLAFMLDDANVSVLLTEKKLRSNLPEVQAPVVCLDVQRFDNMPRENPTGTANATDLAYVIYTSGSTGLPKGVAVPHRAIVRLVRNTNYVEFIPADRIAQASNASFDAATFEIWGALLNGASLIGIPQEVLLSPKRFARTIREQKVSTLFLTTALFHEIANEAPTAFQPLRYLLFGGQTCDPKWVRRVVQSGRPQHLLNVYGPTESTTFATWHRVESVDEFATTVPIGRPISNTQLYVLDRHLQPVPVGVIGELYIGGDGLAREYLNRPELTSEKFIVCPLPKNASVLLYKTGDFGRYRPDGTIDFVGRIDQQVKIRGFRIELQEIEAVLSQHPGVSKSAVIARQMDGSEKRLLAYFVPTEGAQPLVESLRAFLREKLPDYMVPSFFVVLKSLPITANGKIDHAALPDPGSDSDPTDKRAAEPRTSIEEGIAQIWKELLRVKRVSIHDNFFDLGGHSLLGIQLIARLEKRFGKHLPVAVLFQSPTIHQLGKILRNGNSVGSWDSLIPVQLEGSKTPFFWVHGDMSNAVLPAYLGSDQPLYSLEHQARDGRPAEYKEVQTIAKKYLDELRGVRSHGPYLLGGYSFGSLVAYEMAQQLKRQGEDVPLLFMLDPPGVRVNHSRAAIRGELQRHFREIASLPLREKFNYLVLRVAGYVNQRAARMRDAFNRIRWNLYLWSGRRLPASLRSPYILRIYVGAAKNYAPQPYSGTVAIFKALPGPYRPEWNWKKFITGPLQIYERPGNHMDLRKEPHVRHWAVRLKELLDRVQEQEQVPHL